jgi:hypothetical protein
MIAYNSQQLDNRNIQEQAEIARDKKCITEDEYQAIVTAYPDTLYTPHFIMKVGLFILTTIVLNFSLGFLFLLGIDGGQGGIGAILFLFAFSSYGVLEYMVREKKHFKSGTDAALMWWSGAGLIGAFVAIFFETASLSPLFWASLVFAVSLFFTLRFTDISMTILAHLSFLAIVFSICLELGVMGRYIAPFAMVGASLGVYLLAGRLLTIHTYRHYMRSLEVLRVIALVTFYLCGNYFVVKQANDMLLLEEFTAFTDNTLNYSLPQAPLFWTFTILVPPAYIYLGLRRKDRILICTGLLLIAMAVFSVRYYHSIAPIEVAMTLGGLIMILIAYAVIKYLIARMRNMLLKGCR